MERTILVVEDSPTQAQRLTLLLESQGYRADVAPNGREALDRVHAAPPNLIISDVVMPEMDGYALCKAVKASARTRRIPFVLLTDRKTPMDVIKGLEHGADNFITKPFEDDYLLERIKRIFEHLDLRRKGHFEIELNFQIGGHEFSVSADKQQIIELLLANFEELCVLNSRLEESRRTLEEYARTLEAKVEERTRELRSLFDGVPVGLYRSRLDGQIADANPALAHILGYPDAATLRAANFFDLVVDPEGGRHLRARLERDGAVHDFEVELRRRDGSTAWVQYNGRAVRDDAGRTVACDGAVENVTERKRAQEEVRLLETLTLAIRGAESIDAALSTVLSRICEAGGFAYGELWLPTADRAKLELSPAWHSTAPDLWKFRQATQRASSLGNDSLAERARAARQPVWTPDVTQIASFARRTDAAEAGLRASLAIPVLAGTDVTVILVFFSAAAGPEDRRLLQLLSAATGQLGPLIHRKRIEDTLKQTEKLASMGYLLAGVAHELNNPLAAVLGRAALLSRKLADNPLVEDVQKLTHAAERCARIVKNFLALARQRPPERRELLINEVVSEVLELLAYQLRVSTVEVQTDLDPELPSLVGDANQLHQVLVNLVTNSTQAMRQKAPPRLLSITTRHDRTQGRILLTIADSGNGIPADLRARIFEPFFTTKPVGEGTGLGLPITKNIVEEHGGTIGLESEVGRGTTFTIALPVDAPPATRPQADAVPTGRPVEPRTILIVDDEPEIAGILDEMLTADGHRVDTASDGLVALERLKTHAYDLILSDLQMPAMDGPELYRRLEHDHPEMKDRIIFVARLPKVSGDVRF